MDELKKPKNIIIVIITDGFENASKLFTRKQIFRKITNRKLKDKWTFIFLGANQDAIVEGSKFGISVDLCLTIDTSEGGVKHAFASLVKQSKCIMRDDKYIPKFSQTDREI